MNQRTTFINERTFLRTSVIFYFLIFWGRFLEYFMDKLIWYQNIQKIIKARQGIAIRITQTTKYDIETWKNV